MKKEVIITIMTFDLGWPGAAVGHEETQASQEAAQTPGSIPPNERGLEAWWITCYSNR